MLLVIRSLYYSFFCINEMFYSIIIVVFYDLVKLRMIYLFYMKLVNRVILFGGSEVLIRFVEFAVYGSL